MILIRLGEKTNSRLTNFDFRSQKGTKLVITPEWARRPIHILDLANKNAKKGTALRAKYK